MLFLEISAIVGYLLIGTSLLLLAMTYPDRLPGKLIWHYWQRFQTWRNRAKEVERALEKLTELKQEGEEVVQGQGKFPFEYVHGQARALRSRMERAASCKDVSAREYAVELACLMKAFDVNASVYGRSRQKEFYECWLSDLELRFSQFEWRNRCHRRAAMDSAEGSLTQMQEFAELHPEVEALPAFQRLFGAIELVLDQTKNGVIPAEQCWASALSLNWQLNQFCGEHERPKKEVQIPAGPRTASAATAEEILTQMQEFAELHPEVEAEPPFQRLYGAVELLVTVDGILSAQQCQSIAISLSWQWRQWHHSAQRTEGNLSE